MFTKHDHTLSEDIRITVARSGLMVTSKSVDLCQKFWVQKTRKATKDIHIENFCVTLGDIFNADIYVFATVSTL